MSDSYRPILIAFRPARDGCLKLRILPDNKETKQTVSDVLLNEIKITAEIRKHNGNDSNATHGDVGPAHSGATTAKGRKE